MDTLTLLDKMTQHIHRNVPCSRCRIEQDCNQQARIGQLVGVGAGREEELPVVAQVTLGRELDRYFQRQQSRLSYAAPFHAQFSLQALFLFTGMG